MKCTKCKIEKPATDEFFQIRADTKKFRKQCRECRSVHTKKYHDEDRELVNRRNRDSYAKHKESHLEMKKKYKEANKGWYTEYHRKYSQERRLDPKARILDSLRARTYAAIKGKNKSASTMKLVGCSIEDLRSHLEQQFTERMSWENYGEWHVDHIKPCCKFDLTKEQEQKKCFHYTNLQPLWAKDNLSKGGT